LVFLSVNENTVGFYSLDLSDVAKCVLLYEGFVSIEVVIEEK